MVKSKHYSENTHPTRDSQVKKYLEFCEDYKGILKPFPCDADQVCLYVTHMMKTLKYISIVNYLSGLNDYLKQNRQAPIDYNDYNVYRCTQGAKRILGDKAEQAEPLLPGQIADIFDILTESPGHVCFRAALLTSFRGLLRKAHVTKSPAMLKRGDFKFYTWGMLLHISKSKTIQFAERTIDIPIARLGRKDLCAVHWVERHFNECKAGASEEAFRLPDGRPLSYKIYQDTLKYVSAEVGLDPKKFSSHSLRRGGATFLLMSGASMSEIKRRGDWTSNCVFKYLKAPLKVRIMDDMRMSEMFLREVDETRN